MAKKNVRDDPSKTQVTENPQMSDIVLVLDKMELSGGIRNQQEWQVFHRAGRQRASELLSQD